MIRRFLWFFNLVYLKVNKCINQFLIIYGVKRMSNVTGFFRMSDLLLEAWMLSMLFVVYLMKTLDHLHLGFLTGAHAVQGPLRNCFFFSIIYCLWTETSREKLMTSEIYIILWDIINNRNYWPLRTCSDSCWHFLLKFNKIWTYRQVS